MSTLLSQDEFTQSFTDRLRASGIQPKSTSGLLVEVGYGEGEPVLKLSLEDAYNRYMADPDSLTALLEPYVQDLRWTVQEPRLASKVVFDNSLPVLRNFVENQPTPNEVDYDPLCPKGPIVYQDVLKSPAEYIVAQFMCEQSGIMTALRRGDILPCCPEVSMMGRVAFTNLAVVVEKHGIAAQPLEFASLKLNAFQIEIGEKLFPDQATALTCVPQIVLSLEESFKATAGLLAIMPSVDQLIISVDTEETSLVELGSCVRS